MSLSVLDCRQCICARCVLEKTDWTAYKLCKLERFNSYRIRIADYVWTWPTNYFWCKSPGLILPSRYWNLLNIWPSPVNVQSSTFRALCEKIMTHFYFCVSRTRNFVLYSGIKFYFKLMCCCRWKSYCCNSSYAVKNVRFEIRFKKKKEKKKKHSTFKILWAHARPFRSCYLTKNTRIVLCYA